MLNSAYQDATEKCASAIAYIAAAHDTIADLQVDLEVRYGESFAAAYELVQELESEIMLMMGRMLQGWEH